MQITVSGITVEVTKKNIKNLHLSVLPPDGRVRVSAPLWLPQESLVRFVESKTEWIKKQRQKLEGQQKPAECLYVSGETLPVWGKPYLLKVEYSSKGKGLLLRGDTAVLTVSRNSTTEQRTSYVNEWYRALLKAEIAQRLPRWERITGLHCESWHTKNMTTRWGTCNTRARRIWLNLQLTKKPVECLDYVLLHELAHLRVANHGRDFIAIMDKYMPNWRELKKRLNNSEPDYE